MPAHINPFTIYNLVMGLLAGIGLLYLLYVHRYLVPYRRFLAFLLLGLLVFSVGDPITDIVAPEWGHLIHSISAVFVIYGLYDPVQNDLRRDEWTTILLEEPAIARNPAEWMRPIDDAILNLFHSAELVLTPSIIAYNIGYNAKEVNRRLTMLSDHGMVKKVERGKYQLTERGERYLQGELVDETETAEAS